MKRVLARLLFPGIPGISRCFPFSGKLKSQNICQADMSNTIEGDIDIDFLGVLTLTIDIELVTFE